MLSNLLKQFDLWLDSQNLFPVKGWQDVVYLFVDNVKSSGKLIIL